MLLSTWGSALASPGHYIATALGVYNLRRFSDSLFNYTQTIPCYMYIHACQQQLWEHSHTHTCACPITHTHAHTHTRTCTHTRTHTHAHTHAHTLTTYLRVSRTIVVLPRWKFVEFVSYQSTTNKQSSCHVTLMWLSHDVPGTLDHHLQPTLQQTQ